MGLQQLLSGASASVNKSDAKKLLHRVLQQEKKIETLKDAGEEGAGMIMGTLAGGATSYLLGRREAENGAQEIRGVPEPLAVSALAWGGAFFLGKPGGMLRTLGVEVGRAGFYTFAHSTGIAHGAEAKALAAKSTAKP
jgi:hypothetical protein